MGLYLILMGVQGAGKGVQARFISQTYGIPHVSTGDLFRAMHQREDELAQRVRDILKSGKLVDDDTTNEIVADRLQHEDAQHGVILDGYPRNLAQADFLEQYLRERGEQINAALLMKLDLYLAFKRAFGRVTHPETGESYNIYTKPDGIQVAIEDHPEGAYPARIVVRDEAGTVLKRRSDDANAHSVITRIDTYLATIEPLVKHFAAAGKLHEIDAQQGIEAVSGDVQRVIDSLK